MRGVFALGNIYPTLMCYFQYLDSLNTPGNNKTRGFLMFPGDIEKKHILKMG